MPTTELNSRPLIDPNVRTSGMGVVVEQRVEASKARQRRRWVFRSAALLSITAVLLCILVTWRRDQLTIDAHLHRMAGTATQLQAYVDRYHYLPGMSEPIGAVSYVYYVTDADRFYASQVDHPVIIAITQPVELHLMETGRGVLIYEQGRVRPEWMSGSDFRQAFRQQQRDIENFEQKRRAAPPDLP